MAVVYCRYMGSKRLLTLLLVVMVFGLSEPAAADCGGPTISYTPAEVVAGDAIIVDGYGWGDNCYDTGPPPGGEGDLGKPLTNIEIVFVHQGGEVPVATGNADGRYEFTAEITVPGTLEPGDFTVETRPESHVEPPQLMMTLLESTESGVSALEPEIAWFGPIEPARAESARPGVAGIPPAGVPTALIMIVGFVVILVITGAVAVNRRH